MASIRAATITEASRSSGDWVFVDLGFASRARSCGLLVGEGKAQTLSFSELQNTILALCIKQSKPLNVLLEAPLSVAFGPNGNPIGRSVERRNGQTRYWYVGLGCGVLVAATYLLRSINDLPVTREIRLFEGLVSFKQKGIPSSHTQDVTALREVIWTHDPSKGRIVSPEALASNQGDRVFSAFRVANMDFGIPPVVAIGA